MSRFNPKGGKKETPSITTASLPDIMFMLLFFFMVSTTLRENTVNVSQNMPFATEITKLEKKSLVSYIYVGAPRKEFNALYGTETKIQLDDKFAVVGDIRGYIAGEWEKRAEEDRPKMTVSLKADERTKMGIINEIKTELRKAEALKINYSSKKKVVNTKY
jgi:biopolymer transport protein ExbD